MNFDKIVFLDIDGVLNHDGYFAHVTPDAVEWDNIDEEKVKLLKEIQSATGCDFVMSSSWRNGWISLRKYKMYKHAYEMFKKYGIDFDDDLARLPNYGYGQRAKEIQDYVYDHNVKHYVVLDDQFVNDLNLVHVKGSVGLEEEDVNKAIEILNKES
jgi:hypothetical protein